MKTIGARCVTRVATKPGGDGDGGEDGDMGGESGVSDDGVIA